MQISKIVLTLLFASAGMYAAHSQDALAEKQKRELEVLRATMAAKHPAPAPKATPAPAPAPSAPAPVIRVTATEVDTDTPEERKVREVLRAKIAAERASDPAFAKSAKASKSSVKKTAAAPAAPAARAWPDRAAGGSCSRPP